MAIFAVNGEKPLRVAEGDAVSGWRIESITPREVSLSGPGGTKTMQPKMDPNLVPPPGQPPTAGPGGRLPIPPAAAGGVRPPVTAGAGPPGSAIPINNPGVLRRPAQPPQGFPR
jgi:general secretion pathway protein N